MRYKIIYIIIITSTIFSQSFFNRIVPEELYYNDARSMSMGKTNIPNGKSSGNIISNPALLSNYIDGIHIDMNIDFRSISERRSIIFKDDWEEALGETDYVFNQNNYFNHSIGLIYNQSLDRFKIAGAISQKPFLSLNYNYEEEVRGNANLADGVILIKDPIVGYQSYSTSGTLDVRSAGISFSLKNNQNRYFSFGIGVNDIIDTRLTDNIKLTIIDDSYYGLDNMSSIDDITNSYLLTAESRFHTVGFQIPITNELILTLSYEEDLLIGSISDVYQLLWSSIVGLPQLFDYIEDELTYFPLGFIYQKPEKRNFGFTYYPKSNVNMLLAFEVTNRYWESFIDPISSAFFDNDINEYKLGFEYAPYNSYPIRAGLVYSESFFNAVEPTATLTLGTGAKIGEMEFDFAMNYSTTKYKYFDIFPLENIFIHDCQDIGCDNVTENKLTFLTTLKIGF